MPFSLPNEATASFPDQAEPDAVDVDILVAALGGTGVISGCAVTAQGTPDMTLAVAVGVVKVGATVVAVTAGNVTITTAHATNPRFDLVVANNAGTKSVTAGTAAANPVFPAIPANSAVLAAVYVPANDTAIGSTQIVDKRAVIGVAKAPTQQIKTVGSGTYTTPVGCVAIRVRGVASGASGGGVLGHASQAAAASGGTSGGYFEKRITNPDATYAYTVGAGGAAPTAGANNGNNGADTTFGAGGSLLTAKGGNLGIAGVLGTTVVFTPTLGGGGISTGGDINANGAPGGVGIRQSGLTAFSGDGGASVFGGPGNSQSEASNGTAGTGPGSGGSGAVSGQGSTTSRAGGAGADGILIIDEFYA